MDKFTPEMIESYFAYLQTRKRACIKDSTLKRRLSRIMAVFNHAHQISGAIASVPTLNVELNVLKPHKPKLTKDQIAIMEGYQ